LTKQLSNLIQFIMGQKGSGKSTLANRLTSRLSRLFILDRMGEYRNGLIFKRAEDLIEYLKAEPESFRVVCRFTSDEDSDAFLLLVWETGNCTLLAEEVDWICKPTGIHPTFEKILKYGRHRQISILAVSRRPAEVSRDLSSAADELISFYQQEPRDLDYLAKCGFDAEQLKTLPKYEYLTIKRGV
jgi:hypothetical protein